MKYQSFHGDEPEIRISPIRFVIYGIALAGPPILGTVLTALLPLTPEQVELVQVGSAIISLFTAVFVWFTFGRLDYTHQVRELNHAQAPPAERILPQLDEVLPDRPPGRRISHILAQMGRHDPALSEVDLHHWLRHLAPVALRTEQQAARERLSPYVHLGAWQTLTAQLRDAEQVEVGPIVIRSAEHGTWDTLELGVGLRVLRHGTWQPDFHIWTLRRSTAARSLPLSQMLELNCPACGSPLKLGPPEWACGACDRRVSEGQLHWQVREVHKQAGGLRDVDWAPLPEGGDHPSTRVVLDTSEAAAQLRALSGRCPGLSLPDLDARIRRIALAWASDEEVEGLESVQGWRRDRLAALGLQPIAGPPEVLSTELLRAERDGWYERVDAKVTLSGVRALRDAEGRILDGNPELPQHWAICIRMAQPSGGPCSAEGFQPWQVLSPTEYLG